MKQTRCKKEFEIVSALRTGSLPHELNAHLIECPDCKETQQIVCGLAPHAAALRNEAATRIKERLPDAALLWRRANLQRKEHALKRATRGLFCMAVLGIGYAFALVAWLLHRFISPAELLPAHNIAQGSVFTGAGIAFIAVCVGAWYLVRADRKSLLSPP